MIKIMKFEEVPAAEIFKRTEPKVNVEAVVAQIIADVIKDRDKAVLAYTKKLDGCELESLQGSDEEMREALEQTEPAFLEILKKAAANIRKFHERQVRNSFIINEEDGVVIGQKIIPVDRAGIYVPGGTAPISSTHPMDALPAKIAGCREVIMVTPPDKNGKINATILAAA